MIHISCLTSDQNQTTSEQIYYAQTNLKNIIISVIIFCSAVQCAQEKEKKKEKEHIIKQTHVCMS